MIINIPRVVKELKENATEEQRCGLNILERRFYECIRLNKKLDIAVKVLNRMTGYPPTNFQDCETYMWAAIQALREIEEVDMTGN